MILFFTFIVMEIQKKNQKIEYSIATYRGDLNSFIIDLNIN